MPLMVAISVVTKGDVEIFTAVISFKCVYEACIRYIFLMAFISDDAHDLACFHYENTPIQIYRKFHLQKLKIFRYKAILTNTHNLCFEQKYEK